MANVIGLVRSAETGRLGGPLHAVDGGTVRGADEDARALCGAAVRVVGIEDVPDDAGLCQECQYSS